MRGKRVLEEEVVKARSESKQSQLAELMFLSQSELPGTLASTQTTTITTIYYPRHRGVHRALS